MTRRTTKLALALGFAAALVACATIKINQRIRAGQLAASLTFDHAMHVENADCDDCHKGIAKSTGPTKGKYILPKKNHTCGGCHEDEVKQEKSCGMCHKKGADKKIELSRINRELIFDHAAHIARLNKLATATQTKAAKAKDAKGKDANKKAEKNVPVCKRCHPKAYTNKKPGMPMMPKMTTCTGSCHEQDYADQKCDKCHSKLQRQRLEAVAALGHQGNWLQRHGVLAKNGAGRCAQCHDQTYCGGCHAKTAAMPLSIAFPEKVNRRYIHRGDFVGRHMVQARARPTTCRKCHGAQQCRSCHEMRGVVRPAPAKVGARVRQVHGPQWMTPGAAGSHGRAARRNASKCASCHDQGAASNCVKCHKVGALGGNPHPKNFKWADKSGQCRSNPMCLTCHVSGAGCR